VKKKKLLKSKISLRKNPLCPIGNLLWKKYYWICSKKKLTYESDYWGVVKDPDGKERNLIKEWEQQVKNLEHIIDFLKEVKPGKLLDIGCGAGFLLSVLNNKWDKYGVDVSTTALEYCSRYAKVYQGELTKIGFKKNMFDVIVMNHVIEHLSEPLKYIIKIKKILKDRGILIIATPDFDSGCARHFANKFRMLHDRGHISLFTSFSLVKMLEDYRFEIIHIDYPFFDTEYFTKENMYRMFNTSKVSPPFYGNHVVVYSYNNKK
jgi:2-polyprenyl-3-methyl-5-hydroxy-6-metoxy-1,4-benzoquinol methylase